MAGTAGLGSEGIILESQVFHAADIVLHDHIWQHVCKILLYGLMNGIIYAFQLSGLQLSAYRNIHFLLIRSEFYSSSAVGIITLVLIAQRCIVCVVLARKIIIIIRLFIAAADIRIKEAPEFKQ